MEVKKLSDLEVELKLGKHLDMTNSGEFKNQLRNLMSDGINVVRVDFSVTENIDSSGLGKILYFTETLRKSGGDLIIINVQNQEMRSLFELLQLDKVVKVAF